MRVFANAPYFWQREGAINSIFITSGVHAIRPAQINRRSVTFVAP